MNKYQEALNTLKASDINGSIVSQTINDQNVENLAKQYQISVGKAEKNR